jgi:hypothetical protein
MNDTILSERHWLQQPRFQALFGISAGIGIAVLAFGVIANIWGGLLTQAGISMQIFGAAIGITGAAAALYLWVGMGWYWLCFDRSVSSSKKFWFVMLLLLNWVGAIAYYLVVYRKSVSAGAVQ